MRISTRSLGLLVVSVAIGAGISPAGAACTSSVRFYQGIGNTTSTYHYIRSPGIGNKTPGSYDGKFWLLGQGTAFNNGGYTSDSWIHGVDDVTPPFYIYGDWGFDALIQGCPTDPSANRPSHQVILLSDQDTSGNGYFAAACLQESPAVEYDFALVGSDIVLAPIPSGACVFAPNVNGTTVSLTVGCPPYSGTAGIYSDGSCGGFAAFGPTGYGVYYKRVSYGAPLPTDRRRAAGGWTLLGSASNGEQVAGVVTCAQDSDLYLATTLIFDGTFETDHVSASPRPVRCGPSFTCEVDGAPCEDGTACTDGDFCLRGICLPGLPVDCDDGQACTQDSCDIVMGTCVHVGGDDPDDDGLCGDVDSCPNSIQEPTVVVNGCDSGVPNAFVPPLACDADGHGDHHEDAFCGRGGCTISDLVAACSNANPTQKDFEPCVKALTKDLKDAGVISGKQKNQIDKCAKRKPHPSSMGVRNVNER